MFSFSFGLNMRLGFSHFQVRLLAAQSRIVNCWYGILGRRAGILVWRRWRCSVGHIRYGAAKRSLGRNSWRSSVSAYPRRFLEFQDDVAGKRAKSGRRLYVTSQPDRDRWPNWRQARATVCLSFLSHFRRMHTDAYVSGPYPQFPVSGPRLLSQVPNPLWLVTLSDEKEILVAPPQSLIRSLKDRSRASAYPAR